MILSRTLSWPVRFMMVALVTKSYQWIPSIRRWHDMLNASSFCSSDFSSLQVSASCRTETTKALYSRSYVDRHNFSRLQIFASWPIMLDASPIRRCISGADRPEELIALPRYVNWELCTILNVMFNLTGIFWCSIISLNL